METGSIVSNVGAGTLGLAAMWAWIKVVPMLMARILPKQNGNGYGESASLELKMQSVVERVAGNIVAPIVQSMNRVEAALTRMEATQNNMNATLSGMASADQARALGSLSNTRGRSHGD